MRGEVPIVPGDLLGLPGLRTTAPPEVGDFSILVRARQERPDACPYCGCTDRRFRSNGTRAGKPQELLDEPRGFRRLRIELTRRNFRCASCGDSGLLPLWGVREGQRATDRLVGHVEHVSLFRPFAEVELMTGLSRRKVREVFDGYVNRLRETVSFEPLRVIGLDGIKIRKKGYYTVITDVERRLVLHMWGYSRGKKKDDRQAAVRSLVSLLKNMNGAGQIEVVVMDMSSQYRSAVKQALPQAKIVIDRFHLQRMANVAVDCARIRLNKELRKGDGEAEICNAAPLRKPFARLRRHERRYLVEWLRRDPLLRAVYKRKEEFRRMWPSASATEARRFYEEWLRPLVKEAHGSKVDEQVREDFKELLSAMGNWGEYIFNYFDLDRKPTNALTEWANRRVRDLLRESRSCSVEVLRAKLIFGTWMRRRMKEGAGRWGESTVIMARTRKPSTSKPRKASLLGGAPPASPASAFGRLRHTRLAQALHERQARLPVESGELELQPRLAPARTHEQRQFDAELAVVAPHERVRAGGQAVDAHIGGPAVPGVAPLGTDAVEHR
jgi:transposase